MGRDLQQAVLEKLKELALTEHLDYQLVGDEQ